MEFEVDFSVKKCFDVFSRFCAQPFQGSSLLTNNNTLLRIALYTITAEIKSLCLGLSLNVSIRTAVE